MTAHKETDISGNKKIKVCSSQYSYIFGGDQVHFPYSIATNVSYSIQFPEIKDNFHFEKVFLLRDFLEENIEFARDADILLCSCYCWNIEITKKLAKSVKEINPKCLIVFGGPEVPDADRHNGTFFQNHPYVDIAVHGEGEVVLHNILKKYIEGGDFKEVNGIEMKDHLSPSQERMSNLDLIPSPWSTDLIWDLVDKDDKLKYVVSWETNRGCPYSCVFCFSQETQLLTEQKVFRFEDEELESDGLVCEHGHIHKLGKENKSIIFNGEKECIKLSVSNGTSLTLTPDHQVCVVKDDKIVKVSAGELKVNDWVPIRTNQNKVLNEVVIPEISHLLKQGQPLRGNIPKTLNADLAWLMGLLIGDGTIKKKEQVIRFVADPIIEAKIKLLSQELFSIEARSVVIPTTKKVKHINISSVLIVKMMRALGLSRDEKLKVPHSIFCSPKHVVEAFLEGLWAADGYTPKIATPPYLTTASKKLAEDVASLICWIGDIPRINLIDQKKYKPNVKYNVQSAYRVEHHRKGNRERDVGRGSTGVVNRVPLSFNLTPDLKKVPNGTNGKKSTCVPRARLRRFDPTHPLLQDDVYYAQVIKTENVGLRKVYDLMNQPNHEVANSSMITSNCDWASATKTKVRNFTEEKLYKEIEWFGKNNIVYVDCCDGNYGIFVDRDFRISEKLAETKSKTGFPEKIGLTWAKMSSEKILPMAKVLANAGLLRAVSLSVQSLDEDTLKIIKRTNIKFDKFESLVKRFDDEGIQTYTELIKGLPGETLTSFKNNWEILAGIYPPPTIMAWECSIFVNAPLNDEFYKKLHGVKAFSSPVFMSHTNVDKKGVPEFERMVCDVSSLGGKIKDVYLHNWTMMVFHSFGVLELIARYFNTKGVSYTKFYDVLGEFSRTSSLFGYEYKMAMDTAEKGYSGGGWEHFDPTLGSICWPVEEASWLRLTRDKQALKSEIERFLSFFVASNKEIEFNKDELEDLINFHIFTINSAQEIIETKHTSQYDWKKFFITREPLENKEITYVKSPLVVNKNPIEWGYESIWYGRRSQRYKIKLRDLKEVA